MPGVSWLREMRLEARFTKRQFWLPLAAGILLTVLFYLLGALLSGGGHSLTAITIFFPYGVTLGRWLEGTRWEFVAAAALLLQFPLYGLLLAWTREHSRGIMLVVLLSAHCLGAAVGVGIESSRQKRLYSVGEVNWGEVGCAALLPGTTPANNGMHPTRVSLNVIRQLGRLCSCVRAGDAGR